MASRLVAVAAGADSISRPLSGGSSPLRRHSTAPHLTPNPPSNPPPLFSPGTTSSTRTVSRSNSFSSPLAIDMSPGTHRAPSRLSRPADFSNVGSFPEQSEMSDVQFVTKPSSSLTCPICHEVCTDPVITSQCNHSFCTNCITQSIDHDMSCPMCRCRLRREDLHPNLALAGLILELQVYCPNRRYGCEEIIRLETLRSHAQYCTFQPSKCPHNGYGCEFMGTRTETVTHLQSCAFEKLKGYIDHAERRFRTLENRIQELEAERDKFRSERQAEQLEGSAGKGKSAVGANGTVNGEGAPHAGNGGTPVVSDEEEDTWPLGDVQCRRTISDHRTGVTSLAYSTGVLYSGAYDGTTKVFNAESGALVRTLYGHKMSVWALAVHKEANRLLSAGSDGAIKVWDLEADDAGSDGTVDAAGDVTGAFMQVNGESGCVRTLREHNGKVYSLVVAGDRLYSASSDKTIKVWNLNTLECIQTLVGHTDGVNSLTPLGPDRLASAASDKTVRIWDLATSRSIHVLDDNDSEMLSVAWSGDSSGSQGTLFASTYDASIVAYSAEQGFRKVGVMQGHNWEVWQLQYAAGVVFSGSFDHTIKRWDTRMFQCTHTMRGHKGFVHALALGNDNLISGCADRTIKIWR